KGGADDGEDWDQDTEKDARAGPGSIHRDQQPDRQVLDDDGEQHSSQQSERSDTEDPPP
ncbi:MAG TPA: hypothetical protein IAA98_09800, partial [Candidatus Avipropionibacterium avicola]|nr:hypothetical protein [Candidatus Avipropionibacterium avicola]